MAKLDWLETFEVGVRQIDDDHRAILALMRQIETAASEKDFALSDELLDDLLLVSEKHFAREEALLAEFGYPGVDAHRHYHGLLLKRATEAKDVCKGLTARRGFKECCDELFAFLIDDIVNGDFKFKSYLEEKGLVDQP